MNILKQILRKIYHIVWFFRSKMAGVQFLKPNYVYFDRFNEASVVIDVGCGHEAEFSRYLIEKYNLRAFGVDPTRKHAQFLKIIEESTKGKFRHLALAITGENGFITFNESEQNESGSILSGHTNIINDDIKTYEVESVNLHELVRRIGLTPIDFIKLDLEGAEYKLLEGISEKDLEPFKQIYVEFHHHCTNYSIRDTKAIVNKIRGMGFKVFTLDRHNYLFYK